MNNEKQSAQETSLASTEKKHYIGESLQHLTATFPHGVVLLVCAMMACLTAITFRGIGATQDATYILGGYTQQIDQKYGTMFWSKKSVVEVPAGGKLQ